MILSTLVLFGYFFFISLLHDDYLSYAELNDTPQYLGLSFIIKWAASLFGLLIYLAFNFGFLWRKSKRSTASKTKTQATAPGPETRQNQASDNSDKHDPFAEIRNRERLRSRADFLIETKKPSDP